MVVHVYLMIVSVGTVKNSGLRVQQGPGAASHGERFNYSSGNEIAVLTETKFPAGAMLISHALEPVQILLCLDFITLMMLAQMIKMPSKAVSGKVRMVYVITEL